ncbi:MAG: hypothetical protein ACKKL6_03415 [Candidatus Komeilibacteria bacterium]
MNTLNNQKTTLIIIIAVVVIIAVALTLLSYQQGYKSGLNVKQGIYDNLEDNQSLESGTESVDENGMPTYNLDSYDNALLEKYKHLNNDEQ